MNYRTLYEGLPYDGQQKHLYYARHSCTGSTSSYHVRDEVVHSGISAATLYYVHGHLTKEYGVHYNEMLFTLAISCAFYMRPLARIRILLYTSYIRMPCHHKVQRAICEPS